MSSDADRLRLIKHADRLMKQSRALRKLSDNLHQESARVRDSAMDSGRPKSRRKKR